MPVQDRVPAHLTGEELLAQIPPDLLASFEKNYPQILAVNGAHTDAQELAVILSLLRDAENGVFWLNGQQIRVDPNVDLPPASRARIRSHVAGGDEEVDKKKNAIRWAIIMVVGVIAIIVLSSLLGRGRNNPAPVAESTPLPAITVPGGAVVTVTPRPSNTPLPAITVPGGAVVTVTPLPTTVGVPLPPSSLPPVTPPSVESIFDGVKLKVGIFYPKTLEIGGQAYYLIPTNVSPTAGWWIPQAEGAASWVNGSSVNYAIGLPFTERNEALMNAAQEGDPIYIRMSTGQVLEFSVRERRRVSPQQVELFRQKRPGVTIALTGGGSADRLVVIGEYNSANEISGGYTWSLPGAVPLNVWEQAVVGDLTVQVDFVQFYVPTDAAVQGFLPTGQVLYVLDFSLRNSGAAPISLNNVQAEVVDRAGLRYPSMVSVAKQYGHVTLTLTDAAARELVAGAAISLSAAYMVPMEMATNLTFIVTGPAGGRGLFDLTPANLMPPPTPTPTPSPTATAVPTAAATPTPLAPEMNTVVAAAIIVDQVRGITPTNDLFLAFSLTLTNHLDAPLQLQWADFVLSCAGEDPGCAGVIYRPAELYEFDGRLANALPATVPSQGSLGLVLVFDVSDVPTVSLAVGGQEFIIQLRQP